MTSPSRMPSSVQRGPSRNRRPCKREGCPRFATTDEFCCRTCKDLDLEFVRLESLYSTAGEPALSRDAWLALSAVSDGWTDFIKARLVLHGHIREAGLPMPLQTQLAQRLPSDS
jgi:hypothetical protein